MSNAKGNNKEHIAAADGREPIRADDGRLDFTKSGKAFQIFDEMHKKDENVARKDCLERAIAEADMTPASAATFYQKWRDERGLVHRDDGNQQSASNGNGHSRTTKTATATKQGNRPGTKGNTAAKK